MGGVVRPCDRQPENQTEQQKHDGKPRPPVCQELIEPPVSDVVILTLIGNDAAADAFRRADKAGDNLILNTRLRQAVAFKQAGKSR